MEERDSRLVTYVTAGEHEKIRRIAFRERMSMSSLVSRIVAEWLAEQPEEDQQP